MTRIAFDEILLQKCRIEFEHTDTKEAAKAIELIEESTGKYRYVGG